MEACANYTMLIYAHAYDFPPAAGSYEENFKAHPDSKPSNKVGKEPFYRNCLLIDFSNKTGFILNFL